MQADENKHNTFDLEQLLAKSLRDGLTHAITERLRSHYGNPIDDVIKRVLAAEEAGLERLLLDSIQILTLDAGFREELRNQLRLQMAKSLVQKFGGELEKQVNLLKSHPVTRAKITTAIDTILREPAAV
jgi:hypothetical protein